MYLELGFTCMVESLRLRVHLVTRTSKAFPSNSCKYLANHLGFDPLGLELTALAIATLVFPGRPSRVAFNPGRPLGVPTPLKGCESTIIKA